MTSELLKWFLHLGNSFQRMLSKVIKNNKLFGKQKSRAPFIYEKPVCEDYFSDIDSQQSIRDSFLVKMKDTPELNMVCEKQLIEYLSDKSLKIVY